MCLLLYYITELGFKYIIIFNLNNTKDISIINFYAKDTVLTQSLWVSNTPTTG